MSRSSQKMIPPRTLPFRNFNLFTLSVIFLAGLMIAVLPSSIFAEPGDVYTGSDGIRSVDKGSPSGGGNSSGGGSSTPYNGPNLWNMLRKSKEKKTTQAEQALEQRLNEARLANQNGLASYNNKDFANAVIYFQEAAKKNPDSTVIRENLDKAQAWLKNQTDEQGKQLQDKTAATNMQQAINKFAETLTAAPATSDGSGLDFISTLPRVGADKPTTTLEFGDPKVVNVQRVPSGLPKAIDNAIAGSFADAPPGVANAVSKGYQAVMAHDWKVASAWFGDALNRDPGNANLKHLVDIVNETPKDKKPTASPRPDSVPAAQTLTSLNASASTMSNEHILTEVDKIMNDIWMKEVLQETK